MRCLVPESGSVRSGRGIIGDGAAQIGALAVDELLVAVEVGWGGGLLLGVEGKERCTQDLRGLCGLCVVDEIAACIALRQQVMPFVVDFDMLFEAAYGLLDVAHQQCSVATLHADSLQPRCSFRQFIHQLLPGTYGLQRWLWLSGTIANGQRTVVDDWKISIITSSSFFFFC